jgi:hypothetical protein
MTSPNSSNTYKANTSPNVSTISSATPFRPTRRPNSDAQGRWIRRTQTRLLTLSSRAARYRDWRGRPFPHFPSIPRRTRVQPRRRARSAGAHRLRPIRQGPHRRARSGIEREGGTESVCKNNLTPPSNSLIISGCHEKKTTQFPQS